MTRRYLTLGESYPLIVPYAGSDQRRVLLLRIGSDSAYVAAETGLSAAPVAHGDTGIRRDTLPSAPTPFYVDSVEQPHVVRCATVGCHRAASRWITWQMGDYPETTEPTCPECASGYLWRPSLHATEADRADWPIKEG